MKTTFRAGALRCALLATALFGCASISHAQGEGITNQMQMGTAGGMTDQLVYGTLGSQVARDQSDAFQAFLKENDPAKKSAKGRDFLKRYPTSLLNEQVNVQMMYLYRNQADWKNEYAYADQALALNPKDVDVLATLSWTIAHVYQPSDPNAADELAKAESSAKQALEVLAALPKPAGMTDEQFAAAKARRTAQAHSALGLVDFRRNDYENSAKELEQSPKDQTDNYVLGIDYAHSNRPADAARAFHACSATAGALQDACTKNAATADAQSAQQTK
jgi:hypothetical protein